MKRLFAAIKIHPTPEYTRLFNELSTALRHEHIKWVEPENVHLTLKFFGETNEAKIPVIQKALAIAATQSIPFILKISNTGLFGSNYDPKVIWFGVEKNITLVNMAKNILDELQKCGWEPDRQNFVPHLTIGRIRGLKDKSLFQQIISKYYTVQIQEEKVKEIILYESILRREGPLYINMFTAKL